MKNQKLTNSIDWITVMLYAILSIFGWMTIYSVTVPADQEFGFDFSHSYGRQFMFMMVAIFVIFVLLFLETKIFERFSLVFYIGGIFLLLGLFVFGATKKGQTNWYEFGSFLLQPSEFVKTAVALFLAKFLSDSQVNLSLKKYQYVAFAIMGLPIILILMQPDAGSAMIFLSLFFVLYREGLPAFYLWAGFIAILTFILALIIKPVFLIIFIALFCIVHYIFNRKISRNIFMYLGVFVAISAFAFSVSYMYDNVLEPHQQDRINVLLGKEVDLKKEGYNLNQSMIAIGSGGLVGKGWLEGTQTKGGFVPEHHTDYIFTAVGEEWGFLGNTLVITLFSFLFLRILYLAERQKTRFSRIYGYCVASYLFMHFFVNIAMLIKLFPTIGVPLPFFSYGGSSFIAFTIMLFIFIKLDANKVNEW
jgi:rod shape determining protein RodA